jgi:hypothetical protein
MTDEQRFEALKLTAAEEATNLRFETTTAHTLVTAFATLELALAAWVVNSHGLTDCARYLLLALNAAFGVIIGRLIFLNYQRREGIAHTLDQVVSALDLRRSGAYLPGQVVWHGEFKSPWKWWYIGLIALFCCAQVVPLLLLERTT